MSTLESDHLGITEMSVEAQADTMYLHANIELKEQALAKTQPFKGRLGRYRPPDKLLAFLQSL
jgi:hypothetical protein